MIRLGRASSFGWLRYPDAERRLSFCVVKDATGTRIKPMMVKARNVLGD